VANQVGLESILLQQEIEQFLYSEADLLDERKFEQWLDLMTDDVRYLMPLRRNVAYGMHSQSENTKPENEVCWFDDDKETLTKRVAQIRTGQHWAEEPLSRVCHIVSNVQIVEKTMFEVTVKSRMLVYRNRLQDEENLFIGKRQDVLRKVGSDWKIASRTMLIEQSVLLPKNLTIFF
jgi:3-phenylpropionate/cinnamic acid dioxygenase small subunit